MCRPEKPVDWVLVDNLLMANCHGTEIAPHFNMHPNTFYRKVEETHGMSFSEYSLQMKCHGDSLLRSQQYLKALGKSDLGDNTMLIWLGKNRLNQADTAKEEVQKIVSDKLDAMLEQFKQAQAVALKIDESNIISEQ